MNTLDREFHVLGINRVRCQDLIQSLSFEDVERIPATHNNSLLWNYGHLVVTQHLLSFGLCKMPLEIPKEIVDKFRKGSKAEPGSLTKDELNYFIENSPKLVEKTANMYRSGKFADFNHYVTSFGVELDSIEDAVVFNNIHEGLHLGYMMALRRLILSEKQ